MTMTTTTWGSWSFCLLRRSIWPQKMPRTSWANHELTQPQMPQISAIQKEPWLSVQMIHSDYQWLAFHHFEKSLRCLSMSEATWSFDPSPIKRKLGAKPFESEKRSVLRIAHPIASDRAQRASTTCLDHWDHGTSRCLRFISTKGLGPSEHPMSVIWNNINISQHISTVLAASAALFLQVLDLSLYRWFQHPEESLSFGKPKTCLNPNYLQSYKCYGWSAKTC